MCIAMIMIFSSIYAQRVDWSVTPRYTEQELIGLRKRIMSGDTVAYFNYVFHAKYSPESLPYALFMANNHHYPEAFFDVYNFTLMLYKEYNLQIDSTSYYFAFQYLLKGAELGSSRCYDNLAIIYYVGNRFVARDTVKAKEFCTKEYEDYDTKQRTWDSFKQIYQRAIEARKEEY
jgi:hypothetical protein